MRLLSFVAAAAVLSASLSARADTFDFSFGKASSAFSGSGTLTGSLISTDEYLITAVTGTTQTGNSVEHTISIEQPGTFPTDANGGYTPPNDNDLFLIGGKYTFDAGGLSYLLDNGAQVNLAIGSFELLKRKGGATVIETRPISITAVTPEPSSLVLLGTGVLGILGVTKRRFA